MSKENESETSVQVTINGPMGSEELSRFITVMENAGFTKTAEDRVRLYSLGVLQRAFFKAFLGMGDLHFGELSNPEAAKMYTRARWNDFERSLHWSTYNEEEEEEEEVSNVE